MTTMSFFDSFCQPVLWSVFRLWHRVREFHDNVSLTSKFICCDLVLNVVALSPSVLGQDIRALVDMIDCLRKEMPKASVRVQLVGVGTWPIWVNLPLPM